MQKTVLYWVLLLFYARFLESLVGSTHLTGSALILVYVVDTQIYLPVRVAHDGRCAEYPHVPDELVTFVAVSPLSLNKINSKL